MAPDPNGWYYRKTGLLEDTTVGPITEDAIVALIEGKKLKPDTAVLHAQITNNTWQHLSSVDLAVPLAKYREKLKRERAATLQKQAEEQQRQAAEQQRQIEERRKHAEEAARRATENSIIAVDMPTTKKTLPPPRLQEAAKLIGAITSIPVGPDRVESLVQPRYYGLEIVATLIRVVALLGLAISILSFFYAFRTSGPASGTAVLVAAVLGFQSLLLLAIGEAISAFRRMVLDVHTMTSTLQRMHDKMNSEDKSR